MLDRHVIWVRRGDLGDEGLGERENLVRIRSSDDRNEDEVIAGLSLAQIDQIVERRFRYVRPRWEDRPAVWRQLLQSAQSTDIRRSREFDVRGLQLLAGDLL